MKQTKQTMKYPFINETFTSFLMISVAPRVCGLFDQQIAALRKARRMRELQKSSSQPQRNPWKRNCGQQRNLSSQRVTMLSKDHK